jgi:hypothetical protein
MQADTFRAGACPMIRFKEGISERLKNEYFSIPMRLRDILLYIESIIAPKELIITSIYRTEKEQRDICARLARIYRPSVHMVWRGVDIRTFHLTEQEISKIVCNVNAKFAYNPRIEHNKFFVAIYEGDHIHLQISEEKRA